MATGYTHGVAEGKVTEFTDFAKTCARAFGALIHMRDDANDAPIQLPEVDPYYTKAIQISRRHLVKVRKMDAAAKERAVKREYKIRQTQYRQMVKRSDLEIARFSAMLEQVKAWEPPSPQHVNFKKFMVEQLTESIRFADVSGYAPGPVESPAKWHAKALSEAERGYQFAVKRASEEVDRVAERREWIRQLQESLK